MAATTVLVFEYAADIDKRALPARIVDEWELTLKNARQRILDSLARFLDPDYGPARFADQIADASSDAYEEFVNPAFPNADMIKLKQRTKLATAYDQWKNAVQAAFVAGGVFETNVTNKKPKFSSRIQYVIGSVGFKPELWGPVSKLALLLVRDLRVPRYITAGESFSINMDEFRTHGNAYKDFGRAIVPAVISSYVFGVVMYLYVVDAVANNIIPATDGNTLINNIVTSTNTRLNKIEAAADAGYIVTLELQRNTTVSPEKPRVYAKVEHQH